MRPTEEISNKPALVNAGALKVITMILNRQVTVVFQPKPGTEFSNRRRFGIGVKSLAKYIGENNAKTAIEKAIESQADKYTKIFRTHGRVDFYFK